MNIAFLIGTGVIGQDVFHKLPWADYVKEENNLFVASRVNTDVHLDDNLSVFMGKSRIKEIKTAINKIKDLSKDFSLIYDSEYMKKDYTKKEIEILEEWLGISFRYISSINRMFYNKENNKDIRPLNTLNFFITGLTFFFRDFYKNNNIDIFVTTLEDDDFSLVAYFVAKKLGIKIISLGNSKFPKRGVTFYKDFNNIYDWKKESSDWDEILSLYSQKSIAGIEKLEQNLENWKFNSIVKRFGSITYIFHSRRYFKHVTKSYPYEKLIFPEHSFKKALNRNLTQLFRLLLNKKIVDKPDFSFNYFFFPLHYTEDAQITFKEPFVDQIEYIYKIARVLPTNYYLFVKPHPHYFGTDVSFRELLKTSKLENVKLIDPKTPSVDLITNSAGVITLNSTTGFESLIFGIPVITLGHDFYCKEGITYLIRDINDLPPKIMDSIKTNKNFENRKRFVKKVYSNTMWLEDMYDGFRFSDRDGKKIANVIDKIIESEFKILK